MRSEQALSGSPWHVGARKRHRAPQEAFCGDTERSRPRRLLEVEHRPAPFLGAGRPLTSKTTFGSPWEHRVISELMTTDSRLAQNLEAAPTPSSTPSDLQPRGFGGGRRETARRDAVAVMPWTPEWRETLRRAGAGTRFKRPRSGKRRHCSIWCCNQMVGGFPRSWSAEEANQRTS